MTFSAIQYIGTQIRSKLWKKILLAVFNSIVSAIKTFNSKLFCSKLRSILSTPGLKVLVMMIGEFDMENYFIWEAVKSESGYVTTQGPIFQIFHSRKNL
jgi:hypothetical protein